MTSDLRPKGVRSRGFSLLEVLVSIALSAFAMLGALALQARAASMQKDAMDRKAATELTLQLAERMRANPAGYLARGYVGALAIGDAAPALKPCAAADCTADELAARDLAAWFGELRRHLPAASAFVTASSALDVDFMAVTVAWQEVRATAQDIAGGSPTSVVADPACDAVGVTDAAYRCFTTRVFP